MDANWKRNENAIEAVSKRWWMHKWKLPHKCTIGIITLLFIEKKSNTQTSTHSIKW